MQQADLVPNVISYSAAISACEKGEQWQEALGLLAKMQKGEWVLKVISHSAAILPASRVSNDSSTRVSGRNAGGCIGVRCRELLSSRFCF